MDISNKELAIIRLMSLVDGRCDEHIIRDYKNATEFYESMQFYHDYFKTKKPYKGYYYLKYDLKNGIYTVEWRGEIKIENQKIETNEHVYSSPVNGYLMDTVKGILKAIKNHKRYLKEQP